MSERLLRFPSILKNDYNLEGADGLAIPIIIYIYISFHWNARSLLYDD
jgi:hypothetical protein